MFKTTDKLAKEIVKNLSYSNQKEISNRVADKIAETILNDTKLLKEIQENLTVEYYDQRTGYYNNKPIKDYVGEKVAEKLVQDVYELNKAEILKEVSSQGILNLLQEQLQESAKQHVLDYITKPINKK